MAAWWFLTDACVVPHEVSDTPRHVTEQWRKRDRFANTRTLAFRPGEVVWV
jgi:hypothetical protein